MRAGDITDGTSASGAGVAAARAWRPLAGTPGRVLARIRVVAIVSAVAAAVLGGRDSVLAAELLPLRPGMAVVTCAPALDAVTGEIIDPNVVALLDVRSPECATEAVLGEHWPAPADHNEVPNPTGSFGDTWTVDNLGTVFGLALDDGDPADAGVPPNIYVTSSSCYFDLPADGRVFRLDGATGKITLIAELPNPGGTGLGNIAFDPARRQLFVTNLEDGRLYRLALDGTVLSTFDPFEPDDGTTGFAPLGERIWGVAVFEDRVFFGTWSEDDGRILIEPNSIHSVGLDDGGDFTGTERLELVMPSLRPTVFGPTTQPIADLAFSRDGSSLFVAQRSMLGDRQPSAHVSGVVELVRDGEGWRLRDPHAFDVGPDALGFFGTNAAGGVDLLECVDDPECPEARDHVLATGDALLFGEGRFVYGLQVLPRDGGTPESSYLIDLDDEITIQDKTGIGDVEAVRFPPVALEIPDPELGLVVARDLSPCRVGLEIEWEEATFFGPEGAGTYDLHRSETGCADALTSPPIASGLTATRHVDESTLHGRTYTYAVVAVDAGGSVGCAVSGTSPRAASCAAAITEVAEAPFPAPVGAVLRVRRAPPLVIAAWPSARPLLPGEHFHLLAASGSATEPFSRTNPEGDRDLFHEEDEEGPALRLFDLRVANACEVESEDEYPAGWDAP